MPSRKKKSLTPAKRPPAIDSKAASFLEVLSRQFRQSPLSHTVPRINACRPDEFFERYYYSNRPVILQGLMKGWTALRRWTPEFFARKFRNSTVEIVAGRDADPYYESNFLSHRTTLRMKDYVSMVNRAGETNDFYLSARNLLLQRPSFRSLLNDLRCPAGFLDPSSFRKAPNFFFGPKGTVTPLHHDAQNILFGQIRGRKLFKLIPPFDLDKVYVERACFSSADFGKLDHARFPLARQASLLECILDPGEFLFLPVGWWHWVRALDISISVSFCNFRVEGGPVVWRFWE